MNQTVIIVTNDPKLAESWAKGTLIGYGIGFGLCLLWAIVHYWRKRRS